MTNTESPEKEEKQLDLKDFKVLIVEDFPFISNILSLSLKEMGVGDVITADDGDIARTKIQSLNQFENDSNIDVVILDWLMPVVDGKTLLKAIRSAKSDTIKFLPVIVCSAYTSRNAC